MPAAAILLAMIQIGRLGYEWWEKRERGEMTDEEIQNAWDAMQPRLSNVSAAIRAAKASGIEET
jgi:hypothetical protein